MSSFFVHEMFSKAYLYLQFGFVIFCQKIVSAKSARKMFAKLTIGIKIGKKPNFYIILKSWLNFQKRY